jgi:hypothetical protein
VAVSLVVRSVNTNPSRTTKEHTNLVVALIRMIYEADKSVKVYANLRKIWDLIWKFRQSGGTVGVT